ncbi:MAG: 4-hydroxy-tetrahydrodipicolinate reductase [bacterium]
MVNVIVCGACGRMGKRIIDILSRDGETELVGAIEAKAHEALGNEVTPKVKVTDNLEEIIDRAEVVIDFTNPQASLKNLEVASRFKKAMVIGTTGHTEQEKKLVVEKAKTIPLLMAPNMSLGVNLLFKVVEGVAKMLKGYDVEIVEAHHNRKKDAPSGTAAKLGETIAQALNLNLMETGVYGRKGMVGPRKSQEIGVHSVRAGDIVGEHTVIFAGTGERLELTHRAHSRDCFARGAVEAAKWIVRQSPGLYDMQDFLGLKGSKR